ARPRREAAPGTAQSARLESVRRARAADVQGQSSADADLERGAVAGGSLRRDSGDRRGMSPRTTLAVPVDRGVELLRVDLSVGAESPAGGARRRARRGA